MQAHTLQRHSVPSLDRLAIVEKMPSYNIRSYIVLGLVARLELNIAIYNITQKSNVTELRILLCSYIHNSIYHKMGNYHIFFTVACCLR